MEQEVQENPKAKAKTKNTGMSLDDRMKMYEQPSISRRAYKGQPIIVRLDGVAFHSLTKGMKRPYDQVMTDAMIHTMSQLMVKFRPCVGYTQSDEITLVWYLPADSQSEYLYGGYFQKFESVIAGYASSVFSRYLLEKKIDKLAYFDCRAFVVPDLWEAYNALLWRQQDATKNAISMAARSQFSHKELQNKNGKEMQELMWQRKKINFNDYPFNFKRGTFARNVIVRDYTLEEKARMTPGQIAKGPQERTVLLIQDIYLSKQTDPLGVLFQNKDVVEWKD